MKIFNVIVPVLCPTLIIISAAMISCEDSSENRFSPEEAQEFTVSSTRSAHQILLLAQDVLDLTSDVLETEGISIEKDHSSTENCPADLIRQYILDETHYDTLIYAGTITMNYGIGTNCSPEGTAREGKIINFFTYIINLDNPAFFNNTSSSIRQTITFEKFKQNEIELEGNIYSLSATGSPGTMRTSSSKITYADGTSIVWNGTLISSRGDSESTGEQTRSISGKLQSSTVDHKYFSADIIEPVTFDYECSEANSLIPVSGKIQLSLSGISATVDYGNGSCDRSYTVVIDNNRKEYSF